jgi:hypothetical protein
MATTRYMASPKATTAAVARIGGMEMGGISGPGFYYGKHFMGDCRAEARRGWRCPLG